MFLYKFLCSSFLQKSSRLEAVKDVEECGKGTSDKDVVGPSFTDNCLENKSCRPQTDSSSSRRDDVLGDNEYIEGRLASYSTGTSSVIAADCIGKKLAGILPAFISFTRKLAT